MLKVQVQEFGPIKEGSIALRPLTILIGPNNVGKSYFAILAYALLKSFQAAFILGRYPQALTELQPTDEVKRWVLESKEAMYFRDLPPQIKDYIRNTIEKLISLMPASINQEIQRCFGSEIASLVRSQSKANFGISMQQDQPPLRLDLILKDKLEIEGQDFDISGQKFFNFPAYKEILAAPFLSMLIGLEVFPAKSSYYFPAARSGILQVHKELTSALVHRSPLAGIEPFEIPRLSGVVADFVSYLLRLETQNRRSRPSSTVADFLESEISQGKIDLQAGDARFQYPDIYYEYQGEKFPLHRTSSMVSELAPIILFLKYVISENDLLIIEEPEAHLHPDNQRIFARAIVKLIRLGVQVLITTHSDYFVQQLSNFILLGGQAPDARLNLGYSEDDYLLAEEVAAYLFHFAASGTGSIVKELKVTEEDGIPEDEFVKIAEAIYDETVRLRRLSIKS